MTTTPLDKLLSFLMKLEEVRIHYTLDHNRDEAIMVIVVVPGERWEIEFFQDESVEIEVFISEGKIHREDKLAAFLTRFYLPEIGARNPAEN